MVHSMYTLVTGTNVDTYRLAYVSDQKTNRAVLGKRCAKCVKNKGGKVGLERGNVRAKGSPVVARADVEYRSRQLVLVIVDPFGAG